MTELFEVIDNLSPRKFKAFIEAHIKCHLTLCENFKTIFNNAENTLDIFTAIVKVTPEIIIEKDRCKMLGNAIISLGDHYAAFVVDALATDRNKKDCIFYFGGHDESFSSSFGRNYFTEISFEQFVTTLTCHFVTTYGSHLIKVLKIKCKNEKVSVES
jgi:hypothetical protein